MCPVVVSARCGAHGGARRPAAVGFEPVKYVAPRGILTAVRKYRGDPATRGGLPAERQVSVPVESIQP